MNSSHRVGSLMWMVGVACFLWSVASARADKWSLAPEVKDTTNVFGHCKVVLHYDSTKERYFPGYTLRFYRDEKLLAEHAAVGFEQVFADPSNQFFLGLSSRGLTKTAWVLFDANGRILQHKLHNDPSIHYCQKSVTLVREWFDKKSPAVSFKTVNGKLEEVSLRSCDTKRILLPLENAKP